jgi:hypothetical protein
MATALSPMQLQDHTRYSNRRWGRVCVSLPALLTTSRRRYSVRIRNFSSGGALITAASLLELGSEVRLSCGLVEVRGMIVWQKGALYGLWFYSPVEECDVVQLLERSERVGHRKYRLRVAH